MNKDHSNTSFIAAGLMSGTSMDGIDSALLLTDGEKSVQQIGGYSLAYDPQFRLLLKACERAVWNHDGDLDKARRNYPEVLQHYLAEQPPTDDNTVLANLCLYFHKNDSEEITFDQVIERSADLHAQAIQELLVTTSKKTTDVAIIGYHGQTLFHRPAARLTIQAGDAQRLSNLTGIAVVYDFRSDDIKHGGQGAPLAPLYHQALVNQKGFSSAAVVNCGGIANITIVNGTEKNLYAYDCGPGNTLIDRFVQLKTGETMDKDGAHGSRGTINTEILQTLKQKAIVLTNGENYLKTKPPKSLDVNDISLIPEVQALSLEDGCATLEAFTAECIVDSLAALPVSIPQTWILAGGGWKNKMIAHELEQRLRNKLGSTVQLLHADQIGWSNQFMEAELFAYLAVRSLRKLPLSLPDTTGVSEPMTGGKMAVPANTYFSAD